MATVQLRLLSTVEVAQKLGMSRQRVLVLVKQGRISGAVKAGKRWVFRASAKVIPLPPRWQDEVEPDAKLPPSAFRLR